MKNIFCSFPRQKKVTANTPYEWMDICRNDDTRVFSQHPDRRCTSMNPRTANSSMCWEGWKGGTSSGSLRRPCLAVQRVLVASPSNTTLQSPAGRCGSPSKLAHSCTHRKYGSRNKNNWHRKFRHFTGRCIQLGKMCPA